MISDDSFLSLSKDFAAADPAAWRSMVEDALKGRVFEDHLVSHLREGIAVQPIYTAADRSGDMGDPLDVTSFLQMHGPRTHEPRLLVRQICDHPQLDAAGCAIARDLKGGVDCLLLVCARPDTTPNAWQPGLNIATLSDLDHLLARVDLAVTSLALEAGSRFLPTSALMLTYYQQRMGSLEGARLEVNADPLAALAREGGLSAGLDQALDDMADLAILFQDQGPGLLAVGVDSGPYSDAGADAAQELACLIAVGLIYLKTLTARGLSLAAAARQIVFTLSADTDIFLNIAQFRAARLLWGRVISAAEGGTPSIQMTLNARTASRMLTRRDPWVNIMRSTVAAFAAGVGGADAMTVHGFDAALGVSGSLGRRIARNIPIILSEESGIGQVADPAVGSWYIETLTRQLAEAAWQHFQWIESCGGMAAVMGDGRLAAKIEQSYQERRADIAHRREPITGVSAFPDIEEKPVDASSSDSESVEESIASQNDPQPGVSIPRDPADEAAIDQALSAMDSGRVSAVMAAARSGASIDRLSASLDKAGQPETIGPWPCHRLAADFEALRDTSDFILSVEGRRPGVFLANLGSIAAHTARATFAKNFFEAGGFEVLTNDGFDTAFQAAKAFKEMNVTRSTQDNSTLYEIATHYKQSDLIKSTAKIACLCGHDDVYAEQAADGAAALKRAGAEIVCLAGRPGDRPDPGIDLHIYEGCDMLGILTGLHERLGLSLIL